MPSNITRTNLKSTSFTVYWTPSLDNFGVTGYEVYRDGVMIGTTTQAYYDFTGLSDVTTYITKFRAYDAAGNKSLFTPDFAVTTDDQPPTIPTNLVISNITASGFKISWNPSVDNYLVAGYEIYLNGTILKGTSPTTTFDVTALNQLMTYEVTVVAYDTMGNRSSTSEIKYVTTGDGSAPTAPTNLNATARSSNSFQLNWTASTDNIAVTGYEIFRNGTLIGTTTTTSFVVSGLSPSTTYAMTVKAFDEAGNRSAFSSTLNVSTNSTVDTQAPTVPANVSASAVSSTVFTLSWSASTDNVGVAGYEVYRDGTLLGTTTSTTYAVTGLTSGTTYAMTVRAYDVAGNKSAASTALNVTTLLDTTAPSVPAGLTSSGVSLMSFNVSWTASTDNVGVAGYEVYRNGTLLGTTANTNYSFTGLTPATTYQITLRAFDAAGNKSAASTALNVTTLTDTTPPSIPTGMTRTSLTPTSFTVYWNPSTDNVGVAGYEVYRDGVLLGTTANTNYEFTGLTPSTAYIVTFRSYDAAGNKSSASSGFGTTTQADTTAPTAPTNLAISATTSTTATLTWTAATDNIAVTGYEVYSGTTLLTTVSGTTHQVTGLSAGVNYTFTVKAKDAAGNLSAASNAVTAMLGNAPTDIALSATSIAENSGSSATVGTLSATDTDAGETFTYSLVTGTGSTDNAAFTISGNTLRTAQSFNFEVKASYSIRVRVTDSGALTYEEAFTITVTNVNEAPTDITLSAQQIAENAGSYAAVGTLSATDPDAGSVFSFSLVSGTGSTDNASFVIDGTTLRSTQSLNFEAKSSYAIRVRVNDGTFSIEKAFTVQVTDVNEAPTGLALSATTIAEGNTINAVIGTLSGVDPDAGSTLTYSLVSGSGDTDNASFNVNGADLRAAVVFDYETKSSYSVRVRVSDGTYSFERAFTISITNTNEGPTDLLLSDAEIAENEGANATVGTLSAVHEDHGATLTYTLVSGNGATDNGSFNISGDVLRATANLDFETKASYSVRIRVSDGSKHFEKAFTITVTDAGDAPTALALSGDRVVENVWVDYEIGALTTTDIDAGDTFTYSLVAGEGDADNANFKIEEGILKAAIVFDYLEQPLHNIRVRVTDSYGTYFEKTFEIHVIQSNAFLNATNRVVTIHFRDTIFSNYNTVAQLKNAITITRNANADVPTYEALGANDTVAVRGNKLVVTFENQVTGYYNRIKIDANALRDRLNNKSVEQVTTPLVVDSTGPTLIKVTMDKKKRELLLQFSERVYVATTGANAREIADNFKKAITFSRNGGAFSELALRDKVSVNGRYVEILLGTALTTNDNRLKIAAEALQDLIGNFMPEIESEDIDLDSSGPILSKVTLAPDNRTITILMNEEASNVTAGSRAVKLAALRAALTLSTNASESSPTYTALTSTDEVDLTKGVLTIKLATALTGDDNRIKIAAGIMRDLFNNTNDALTTSVFTADQVGPTFVSSDLPIKKYNRVLVIAMNEEINNGFTAGKSFENRAALKAAITIKTGDGDFVALSERDSIKVSGNELQITFGTALAKDIEFQVKIAARALQDLTGNMNEEIVTETFIVDTSGPKLR